MSRHPDDAEAAEAQVDASYAALYGYLATACGPPVADRLAAGALAGLGPEAQLSELTAAARSAAVDHLRATRRMHRRCRRAAGLLLSRRQGVISSAELSWLYHHLDHCAVCGGFAARMDAADWDLRTALGGPAPTAEVGPTAYAPAAPAELAGSPYEPDESAVDPNPAGLAYPDDPYAPATDDALDPAYGFEPAYDLELASDPALESVPQPELEPTPEPAYEIPPEPAPEPGSPPELLPEPLAEPAPEPALTLGPPPSPGEGAAHEPVRPTLEGRRTRGGRRRVVLVLLGLVMVAAAAVAAVILVGGLATTTTGRVTQPTPAGSTVGASGSEVRPLRTPFEVDSVRWAVFEDPKQPWVTAARRIAPAAGRVWLFVEVLVRNLGRPRFTPCGLHYRVGDAAGTLYFPDVRVGTSRAQARPTAPLATGALAQCQLGFQIPAQAQGRRLLFDAQSKPARYEVPL